MMADLDIELQSEDDDYPDYDGVYTALMEVTKNTGLEYYLDEECNVAIGRSFATLGDNETGAQFKKAAEDTLEKALGKKVECETHIETWSTG